MARMYCRFGHASTRGFMCLLRRYDKPAFVAPITTGADFCLTHVQEEFARAQAQLRFVNVNGRWKRHLCPTKIHQPCLRPKAYSLLVKLALQYCSMAVDAFQFPVNKVCA